VRTSPLRAEQLEKRRCEGPTLRLRGRLLLFGGHVRGLRTGDGAVEVNVWGWAVRLSLGLHAAGPAAGRGLLFRRALKLPEQCTPRIHFGLLIQQTVSNFDHGL
jgi:hypothetical protein